jgi:hypothetical protein
MFKANNYMITIVDLPSYQVEADRIFSDDERDELADFIAANPHFGKIIPGTGGVRKIRWRARGHGKRGGARVIYYFRDLNMPVFLLAVYAKGEKLDLSAGEKDQVRRLVDHLVRQYQARLLNVYALGKGPA